MADIMRPVPFQELLIRICAEYEEAKTIFGIPEAEFYQRDPGRHISLFGQTCDTPIGPAAGPHTQLAPNIIAAWLTGGSFIELKTVQILDRLELEKPCIDAADEAFNTEWSTEFTLEKAWDEYMKAWMCLWLLETILSPRSEEQGRSFIFNMSVGYDLKGICEPRMQKFIHEMMDASTNPKFQQYRQQLALFISSGGWRLLQKADPECLAQLPQIIPPRMVCSVTLSTMHGCPPEEIESICRYMLTEKKLHTFVKLNPTLPGYQQVRAILDGNGFDYIQLDENAFNHDLKLELALTMLERLVALGKSQGLTFGVKLTNTLGTRNHKGRLPGDEMYMSGRALFPLSINVAALLSRHFKGALPISYSGGASQYNIRAIFETGIQPITMATDLLKPGGYLRQAACAVQLEQADGWDMAAIDTNKLDTLAALSRQAEWAQKGWKGKEEIDTGEPLPLTDCFIAPCVTACAIKQDIPEYLRLAGEGHYADALALIYQRNALPSVTGHICDHQCQYNCTRMDYDNALNIREIKKIVREKGWEEYRHRWHKPAGSGDRHPVAVIGAGPAGLAAGYFLARAGHPVTLFEREANAGGVVRNIVPRFRIPAELVQQDINFIAEHGVKFVYNSPDTLTISALREQGFEYICIGVGAAKSNVLNIDGGNPAILRSFDFLRAFNQHQVELTGEVAVVGAGNTAMDCARAARRLPGVTGVTIIYRRERDDMPAWPEEIAEAEAEGVRFMTLVNPRRFTPDGTLSLEMMKPGERDESGRCRPVSTGNIQEHHFDALITATGENPDLSLLQRLGLECGEQNIPETDPVTLETQQKNVFLIGDVQSGPASIVAAIGGARKAADAILARENIHSGQTAAYVLNTDMQDIYRRKGLIAVRQINSDAPDAFARQEAARCLSCNYVCSKCVDVCPNRANVALSVPGYRSRQQILHLDALCNECGNCAQFCPWQGKPYKDKLTVFSLQQDFDNSSNPGFLIGERDIQIRHQDKTWRFSLNQTAESRDIPAELSEVMELINYTRQQHSYLLGMVEE